VGQDPSRIDRQITANREHIAATLDAIGYRANVPARLAEQSDAILSSAVNVVDSVATRISDASRATTSALPNAAAVRIRSLVPLAIAYFFGMLVGLTWPRKAT